MEVNSSFSQLILNGGLLYNFLVTDDLVLGVNGGLTFMVVNQEARLRTGRVISSVENENIWGAFGGLIAEKTGMTATFQHSRKLNITLLKAMLNTDQEI